MFVWFCLFVYIRKQPKLASVQGNFHQAILQNFLSCNTFRGNEGPTLHSDKTETKDTVKRHVSSSHSEAILAIHILEFRISLASHTMLHRILWEVKELGLKCPNYHSPSSRIYIKRSYILP